MLVLSRRIGEVVRLHTSDGPNEIHLSNSTDHKARLGFTAPNTVKILRVELEDVPDSSSNND